MPKFAELITFREVIGHEPTLAELHSILKKYRRMEIILLLAKLNCLLGTWQNEPNFQLDERLSDYLLFSFQRKLQDLRRAKNSKVVFSRVGILYLIKQACLASPENGPLLNTRSAHSDMGVSFLMANDLLLPFVPSPSDDLIRRIANLLPFVDYISHDHYAMEIGRTQIIFDEIANAPELTERGDFVDVRSIFQDRMGLDHKTFCQLILGCSGKFLNVKIEDIERDPEVAVLRNRYFDKTQIPSDKVAQFFHKITCTEAELIDRLGKAKDRPADDLTVFQVYPFLEILPDVHACLDPGFLVDKAGRSLYWALFFEVEDDQRNRLSAFWGAVFELYVNRILKESYSAGGTFTPEPRFANGDVAFDACLVEGRSLVVFEHKSSIIRADAKYGGVHARLKAELDSKFIEGSGEGKKGLSQLSSNITRFLEGDKVAGVSANDIAKIYPIMVCLESTMISPFLGHYLNLRFREIFKRGRFEQVITPVFTLGVSDVENLLGYLQAFCLSEILESYHSRNKTMFTSLSGSEVPILRNVEPQRNLVKERFSKFADEMIDRFFGEGASRNEC